MTRPTSGPKVRSKGTDPGATTVTDRFRLVRLAAASITLVRNEGDILPLAAERPLRLLHLALAGGVNRARDSIQRAELTARRVPFESRALGRELSAETADEIVASASEFTHVVVSTFSRSVAGEDGSGGMPRAQVELVRRLHRTGVPLQLMDVQQVYHYQ